MMSMLPSPAHMLTLTAQTIVSAAPAWPCFRGCSPDTCSKLPSWCQALDDAGNAFVDPEEDAKAEEEPERQPPLPPMQLRCELQIHNTGMHPSRLHHGLIMTYIMVSTLTTAVAALCSHC
jgi:hypothetical protein